MSMRLLWRSSVVLGAALSVWVAADLRAGERPAVDPSRPANFLEAAEADKSLLAASAVMPLEWSGAPGVYEQELRRRNQNPFYLESRRRVGVAELVAAKRLDSERAWGVLEEFIGVASRQSRMKRYDDVEDMREALQQIDALTEQAMEAGGEGYRLAGALVGLRKRTIQNWKEGGHEDPELLAFLSEESRRRDRDTESRASRVLVQIRMDDGPIQEFELAAALLSEDLETIREVLNGLDRARRRSITKQVQLLLVDLRQDGSDIEGLDEKITVMGKALNTSWNVPSRSSPPPVPGKPDPAAL